METEKKLGFSTRQIHVGKRKNSAGALCDPIYQTSTFMFETVEQGGARFAGTETGYVYSRPANPSTNAVEEKIASLENGEAAMATASGMGAITATLYCSVVAGDEIVADETLYGCTFAFLSKEITQLGVKVFLLRMMFSPCPSNNQSKYLDRLFSFTESCLQLRTRLPSGLITSTLLAPIFRSSL